MTLKTTLRGHEIYSTDGRAWFYSDNGEPADDSRQCIRCGRMPTPEGYDACVGHVDGAISVCCGHGVCEPILMFEKDGANGKQTTHSR